MARLITILLSIIFFGLPMTVSAAPVDEAGFAELREHLITGTAKLPSSHSSVAIPPGYNMLVGEYAEKLGRPAKDPVKPGLEGWALSEDGVNEFIFLSFNEEGHIKIDDWSEIDPSTMLKQISDNTEESNIERRKIGGAAIHVTGWLQQPTLDRATNTVYWTLGARHDDNSEFVNSVALRLGRAGYEKL